MSFLLSASSGAKASLPPARSHRRNKKASSRARIIVHQMAPKHSRIIECLLGDRRWAVPCVLPPDASSSRVFLLRLPEPCIVTDVVLDTRISCCISDVDACCPQLDESEGNIAHFHTRNIR
jgi:hypothetical protein